MNTRGLIGASAALSVGGALLLSATPKLADPDLFFGNVAAYGVLPLDGVWLTAVVVPPLELVLGLALLSGTLRSGAAAIAAVLLLGFASLQGWALATGLDVPCGCFSVGDGGSVSAFTVGRAALLSLLASIAFFCTGSPKTVHRESTGAPS
ncbi:MAG: MauE/DoxX family redox-associated membrane protein [Planctomycetota bacterium]